MKIHALPRRAARISRLLPGCLVATWFIPSAFADFKGADTLAAQSKKWAAFTAYGKPGGGKFAFQNSRLEFLVKSPTCKDLSVLRWTPNKGANDVDWFIQVDAHLDTVALRSNSHANLNLGVIKTGTAGQGYMIAIDRHTRGTSYISGFETSRVDELNNDYQKSPALDATLRIHFDSDAKTLTGSWKSGTTWKYFPPVRIDAWEMEKSDTFTAVLAAAGGGNDKGTNNGPAIRSGQAYFTNFKVGPAKPDLAIEQPVGSVLIDGESKKNFGTATVGGTAITKTFIIRNIGTTSLGNLKIAKGGFNPDDFTISAPSKTSIKPGATATFKILFSPTSAGLKSTAVHILSNDPDQPRFSIELSGEALPPTP